MDFNTIEPEKTLEEQAKVITGIGYRIRSSHGTVLDDWSGATGYGSASFQPDDTPDSINRTFQFVPTSKQNFYRIRSFHGTVLDDWGGQTGYGSASFQPDDTPESDHRMFQLVLTTKQNFYRIRSCHGTVLDDWGGQTGYGSASFQPDDSPQSSHRLFEIVPTLKYKMEIVDFEFENKKELVSSCRKSQLIGQHILEINQLNVGCRASKTFSKECRDSFSWTLNKDLGVPIEIKCSLEVPSTYGSIYTDVQEVLQFGNRSWEKKCTYETLINAEMSPEKAGKYIMSGWVDIAKNIEIPFRAKGVIIASGVINNSTIPDEEVKMSVLEKFLLSSKSFKQLPVLKATKESVVIQVQGILRGSYVLNTRTTYEKIQ